MARNRRAAGRKPATKYAHLQKKIQKQAAQKADVQRKKRGKK